MHTLDYSEFYITNVCNLNCPNCNRFNNYAFSGHLRWNDHANEYAKWAKKLHINNVSIIGGEPLLNPDLLNWVHGLTALWPNSSHSIVTNGTQFDRWPTLYQELANLNGKVRIEISHHNATTWDSAIETVCKFLSPSVVITKVMVPNKKIDLWFQNYNVIKDTAWPEMSDILDWDQLPDDIKDECQHTHGFDPASWFGPDWRDLQDHYFMQFVDDNNVKVTLHRGWRFHESAMLLDHTNQTLRLHNSDPVKAMDNCNFKKCHHFMNGQLYKCGPVALFPEFSKQFKVELTPERNELMNSYIAAHPDWDELDLEKFMKNLQQAEHIDQCTFCPETYTPKYFESGTKKIKLVRLKH